MGQSLSQTLELHMPSLCYTQHVIPRSGTHVWPWQLVPMPSSKHPPPGVDLPSRLTPGPHSCPSSHATSSSPYFPRRLLPPALTLSPLLAAAHAGVGHVVVSPQQRAVQRPRLLRRPQRLQLVQQPVHVLAGGGVDGQTAVCVGEEGWRGGRGGKVQVERGQRSSRLGHALRCRSVGGAAATAWRTCTGRW